MNIILEGEKLATKEDIHEALAKGLGFPDYYGRNLDALWDCLTGWISEPTTIVWRNYEACRKSVGDDAEEVAKLIRAASTEVDGLELRLE